MGWLQNAMLGNIQSNSGTDYEANRTAAGRQEETLFTVRGLHEFASKETAPFLRKTVPQMMAGINKMVAYVEQDKAKLESRLDQQARYIAKLEAQLGIAPASRDKDAPVR